MLFENNYRGISKAYQKVSTFRHQKQLERGAGRRDAGRWQQVGLSCENGTLGLPLGPGQAHLARPPLPGELTAAEHKPAWWPHLHSLLFKGRL